MSFAFYNATSIQGFNSTITVVCENNRILWVFSTASRIFLVRIICFILTTLNNKKNPHRRMIVNEDSALEKSTCVTKLLVDELITAMENNGSDASCINLNNT